MNYNYVSQHQGILAWDGSAGAPIDLRHHVGYGFTFQVMVDLANDTIFNVMSAPPDATDPCIPGPWVPVEEMLTCRADWGAIPQPQATIVLPTGTVAGSICTASLPCKPDAFVTLASGGGDTGSVRVVAVLSGPR